jgi:TolB-like protein/Flp pilus assembly protein TadD
MSLFAELNRRNVFRVAVFYIVVAWLLLQVTDVVAPILQLPDWVARSVLFLLALGFLPAVILSWIYELTPEGVKKESEIDHSNSITHVTGKRLNVMTIVVVLLAVGFVTLKPSETPTLVPEPTSPSTEQIAASSPQLPVDEKKSIAVLPFDNFSDDADNAFFASGVHEDILTHLAKIKDLRVISRTSVERYSENRPPIGEIAGALGVKNIVEGSVRRAGNKVRVTAQLIDATTDEHLWAESFDRDLTDVFAIQTEIARQIVAALEATLTADEDVLISNQPTDNMAAYDLFLRAREILHRSDYSQQKYIEAEPLLTRAIELDPEFALAHALMVTIHGQAVWIGYDASEERKQAARASAEKALALSPDLPEAQAALAQYYYRIEQDYSRSIKELKAAHERLPNDGDILSDMGGTYRRLGLWEESIASLSEAVELDPANLSNLNALCSTLLMLRRWDEVIERLDPILNEFPDQTGLAAMKAWALLSGYGDIKAAREAIAGRPATTSFYYMFLKIALPRVSRDFTGAISVVEEPLVKSFLGNKGWEGFPQQQVGEAYLAMGNEDRARSQFESSRDIIRRALEELEPDDQVVPFLHGRLSTTLALLGEYDEAVALAELGLRYDFDHVDDARERAGYARVLAMAGQVERALDELALALEAPGGPSPWSLALDPSWDFLRDNERFRAMTDVEPRIGVEVKNDDG